MNLKLLREIFGKDDKRLRERSKVGFKEANELVPALQSDADEIIKRLLDKQDKKVSPHSSAIDDDDSWVEYNEKERRFYLYKRGDVVPLWHVDSKIDVGMVGGFPVVEESYSGERICFVLK